MTSAISSGSASRYHDDPLREDAGELAVGAVDLGGELGPFPLDAVGLRVLANGGLVRRDDDQERSVGQQAARRQEVELEDALDAQAARQTLIGQRGVEVAVGDNVGAACERRADHLVDELGAGRGEERGLRPGGDPLAVQEDPTHLLTELGAPRLACENDLAAR